MASTLPAAEVSSESSPELILLKRNTELEEELKQSREREVHLRVKLQQAEERLKAVEEAEERLCSHLGDFEAEVVAELMGYKARIVELTEQLLQVSYIILAAAIAGPSAIADAGADADHDRYEAVNA